MFNAFRWLFSFYRNHKYILAVLVILTPLQSIIQNFLPRIFGFALDFAEENEISDNIVAEWIVAKGETLGFSPIASFGLSFMLLGLVGTILYAYVQTHRAWMNTKLEWLFRQSAFDSVTTKGPDFFNKFRTGDLVTRMTDDVAEKLSWFACSGIFRFYEAILAISFITIMMLSIDPWLTLWTAGPLPILILIFFKSSASLDKRYEYLQARISDFNDVIESCFSGIRVVKAYVRESAQKQKFRMAAEDRRFAEIQTVKVMTIVDSLYMYIWQFGIVIVLSAGGYKVINSGLSIGDLAAFIFYNVWLIFPMFDVGQFLVKSRQSAVSIGRILELEDFPDMVTDNGTATCGDDLIPALRFDNVSFKFNSSTRNIVENFTAEIKSGQTVALVGKIGSGKSWLINMIPRLVDPSSGTITLGGQDLQSFSLSDLRKIIGYVPQEPVLFSDTIRNNITFGREGISDALLEWAIDVSQLKAELESFPDGIDTAIGTRGMAISGGQKQRVALARALVGKPKILILDDCTSALDSQTEQLLWERLHTVMPDITAILITHRPGTLELVDKIFVLDDGHLVEEGTHEQLTNKDGLYAKIYRRFQLEQEVGESKRA